MDLVTKKRWWRPVSVLLAGAIILGANTAVQAPTVETEEIIVGPAETAVQGGESKGYIAVPEEENWEDLTLLMKDPDGNEKEVEAELDDNAGYFVFETNTDKSGTWTVEELRIVEDGQAVVQEVEDTAIEVYDTVDEAFDAPGPQIVANGLEEVSMLSANEYRAAMAKLTAVNTEGDPIPLQITVTGAIEQSFEFYNDGQERTSTEPIEVSDSGTVQITLEAEGAETKVYEIQLVSNPETAQRDTSPVTLLGIEPQQLFAKAVSAAKPAAPSESVVARLGGKTMFETATAISATAVSSTRNAILVNARAFPDALASSSLSRAFNAPILYVNKDSLPDVTLNELNRLGVQNVFLIGGNEVISTKVERQLQPLFGIRRLWGATAIDTAREVANAARTQAQGDTALLASVRAPQDGLIAGAYASRNTAPIFYSYQNSISADTLKSLKNYKRVIIVGGTAAVSSSVQQQVMQAGLQVERASGANRYETAVEFAKKHFPDSDRAIVASGRDRNMVDALTGSFLGGTKYAPILLSDGQQLPASVIKYYQSKDIYVSYLLGGSSAVSDRVLDELTVWTATPAPTAPPPASQRPTTPNGNVRIMLDPGHGWNYNQGVNKNYYEGNQMMYFSHYLRLELEKYGFEVDITRMPDGAYASPYEALLAEKDYAARNRYNSINNQIFSLPARGRSAAGYDLLLSLHSNAPFDIAASELYDSVSNPNKGLAEELLRTVVRTFNHGNRGVKYRYNNNGTDWYGILRDSRAKHAFLIEHGFHTSHSDVSKLMDFDFLKELAAAEAKTLADWYGMR